MGVYEVNCPLSFLALVPQVANEGWRERVRAHHARVNQKVVVEKFQAAGWTWGGEWHEDKDYMHFETGAVAP